MEIAEPYGTAVFGFPKLGGEIFLGKFGDDDLALVVVAFLDVFGAFLLLHHFYVVLFCQPPERLHEGEVFVFHNEVDGRAPFAASEAFVNALGGRNVEGGSLFVVERTESKEVGTPSLEGNKLTDNLCNFSDVEYSLDGSLIYHVNKFKQKVES